MPKRKKNAGDCRNKVLFGVEGEEKQKWNKKNQIWGKRRETGKQQHEMKESREEKKGRNRRKHEGASYCMSGGRIKIRFRAGGKKKNQVQRGW